MSSAAESAQQTLATLTAQLCEAVADFEPSWSRGTLSYVGGGIESYVFKLQLRTGGAIALKVPMVRYIDNDNDQGLDAFDLFRQERDLTAYLRERGFPVPAPVGLRLPRTDDDIGFFALQFIDSDGSKPSTGALGGLLAQLHDLPAPSFRPIAQRLDRWENSIALLIRNRSDVVEALSGVHIPSVSQPQLIDILNTAPQRSALLHMDPRDENMLCVAGKVKAVIDWSNCLIAPPELELYRVAEYGLWNEAVQARYGTALQGEVDADALSLVYRLYTATMLAVVFLSEAPDPIRAEPQVARVQKLYANLIRKLGD